MSDMTRKTRCLFNDTRTWHPLHAFNYDTHVLSKPTTLLRHFSTAEVAKNTAFQINCFSIKLGKYFPT